MRSRLLSELRTPASAAKLASRMGLARQTVNYHLRTLELHGLIRVDSKKRWGGLTERRLVATENLVTCLTEIEHAKHVVKFVSDLFLDFFRLLKVVCVQFDRLSIVFGNDCFVNDFVNSRFKLRLH